jgi:hypothetical protein
MSANVYLIDSDGNRYDFPPDFFLGDDSWRVSSNVQNIPFANGGRDTADGFLESRIIVVTGAIRADSLAAWETKLRAFKRGVKKGGKFYVSDDHVQRFLTVKAPQVSSSYIGEYRIEHPATISFVVEYPFWQAEAQSLVTTGTGFLTDGEEFSVDNSASDDVALPVITITADQGADVPSVIIRNLTDGGMVFEYNDPNFKQGDILEIDSFNGTVKRNGNSTIEYVVQARFPRLQPMVNTIRYEGADVSMDIIWREIYL